MSINSLLHPPEANLPVAARETAPKASRTELPPPPPALSHPLGTVEGGREPRRGRWKPLLLVAAVVIGLVGAFTAGRVSAPAQVVTDQTIPELSTADAWLPPAGTPEGDVERAARVFIAAWQNGKPLDDLVTHPWDPPDRVLRGDISRTPRVWLNPSNPDEASVTTYFPSDGTLRLHLRKQDGHWLVAIGQLE